MAEQKMIKCVVLRDYWDENEVRVPAGTEILVAADQAMDGVEAGSLARVKEDGK